MITSANGTPEGPLPSSYPHDEDHICTPRDHRAERLARELTGRTGHRDPSEIATRIEIALATRSRT